MATPLQAPYSQFFDANGDPLSGGKVYTYISGTLTPKATYTDASGDTEAANPVILDSAGRAAIWIEGTYRIDVYSGTDALIRSVDEVPAFTAGGDMTKAVYDPANIIQQILGTTAVQTFTNKTGSFTAGTTSVAPITLAAGTNLTTASAGKVEFDGDCLYFTPSGAERGIVPAEQAYIYTSTTLAGADSTSAQNVFGVGCDLSVATTYEFEGLYRMSKSAGSTSHTIGVGFNTSGGLGFSTFIYTVEVFNNTTSFASIGAISGVTLVSTANGTVTGAIANANSFVTIRVRGFATTQATPGKLIPQYTLSAAPGGAYTVQAGSYFKIWPVGGIAATINTGTFA